MYIYSRLYPRLEGFDLCLLHWANISPTHKKNIKFCSPKTSLEHYIGINKIAGGGKIDSNKRFYFESHPLFECKPIFSSLEVIKPHLKQENSLHTKEEWIRYGLT